MAKRTEAEATRMLAMWSNPTGRTLLPPPLQLLAQSLRIHGMSQAHACRWHERGTRRGTRLRANIIS